jgi:hypothetical protein
MEQLTLFTSQTATSTEQRKAELRRTTHKFWNDPGHGWLEVRRSDLKLMGIIQKISGYSYEDREGNVYLEEDCDASIYIETLWCNMLQSAEFQAWRAQHLKDEYRESIFIRNLPHFHQTY